MKQSDNNSKIKAMKDYLSADKGGLERESLTTGTPGFYRYPIYYMTQDGNFAPATSGNKRASITIPYEDYGTLIDAHDDARQHEAIKIRGIDGKAKFKPSISVLVINPKGDFDIPGLNMKGTFVQIPREMITDVHWDEFATPLEGRDEIEGYTRSIQRASKGPFKAEEYKDTPNAVTVAKRKALTAFIRKNLV